MGDDIIVPVRDFETKNGKEVYFKKYIVVQNDILQYPICVYRFSENEYSALWMRCTHQGTELQVFGDKLQCPAHSSEFDSKGGVQSGPADVKLRTFPVTIEKDQLKISLKAV
jgi:Rieske Fe-S protein